MYKNDTLWCSKAHNPTSPQSHAKRGRMWLSFKHTLLILERSSMLCLSSSAVFSPIGAQGRIANAFIKTKWLFLFTFGVLRGLPGSHTNILSQLTVHPAPFKDFRCIISFKPHTPLPLIRLLPFHKWKQWDSDSWSDLTNVVVEPRFRPVLTTRLLFCLLYHQPIIPRNSQKTNPACSFIRNRIDELIKHSDYCVWHTFPKCLREYTIHNKYLYVCQFAWTHSDPRRY